VIGEDFTSGSGAFIAVDGAWATAGGEFGLTADNTAATTHLNSRSVHSTILAGDFTLSVDARAVAADVPWSNFAVVFGYQDASNYYFFSSNQSNDAATSGLFKVVNGTSTELADTTTLITPGVTYHVRVEREGSQIRAYRDGALVAAASDGTFTAGQIGLGTRQFQASFDNFVVSGAPVPSPASPPAAPSGLSAAAASSSRIDLSWTDNSSDEGGFKVERSPNGTTWTQVATVGANARTYAAAGLSASTQYYFRVRAYNAAGDSAYSNAASATTAAAPSGDTLGPYTKPSASNTGLKNPGALTTRTTGLTTTQNGQVIENIDFNGAGLTILHDNVTIRNCRFRGKDGAYFWLGDSDAYRPGTVIEDCDIGNCTGDNLGIGRGVSLYRNYVHGLRDTDFWRNPGDCTWEGNYFADWYATSDQPHMDAAQWYWSNNTADKYALNFTVRGNYWDLDTAYALRNQQNAVLFICGNTGNELLTNVTVEYNWFKSGGYPIRLYAKNDASVQINHNVWEASGWGPILAGTRAGQGVTNIGFTGNQVRDGGTLEAFEKPGGTNGGLWVMM
jgi:hypothetical protein